MSPSPAPATSNGANGFPVRRFPVRFAPRVMRRACGGAGSAESASASPLRQAGAAGHRPQPGLELGHHQAARARRSGPTSTSTSSSTSTAATSSAGWWPHREQAALAERLIAETFAKQGIAAGQLTLHADRGSLDDLQAGRPPARRPRRHQDPLPAPRLERQPLLGGAVQDPQVPPGLPRPLRLDRGGPGLLPGPSSPGTTPSTATPGSAC